MYNCRKCSAKYFSSTFMISLQVAIQIKIHNNQHFNFSLILDPRKLKVKRIRNMLAHSIGILQNN